MLASLFSLSLVLFVAAIAVPDADLAAPNLDTSSSSLIGVDACPMGVKSVIEDAQNLNQTFYWNIGSLKSEDGQWSCSTVMPMNYDKGWQYAVTDIDWISYISLRDNTNVEISVSYNFDDLNRSVSQKLTRVQDSANKPKTRYRWAVESPYDGAWEKSIDVSAERQQWSGCGAGQGLKFEWRVRFANKNNQWDVRPNSGIVGDQRMSGGNLILRLGLKYRSCQ